MTGHSRWNIGVRSGVLMGVEGEDGPRPLGLVIVAIIAALLWSLVAPKLGADGETQGSIAPSAVAGPVERSAARAVVDDDALGAD